MRPRIRTVKPDIFHDEELWALGERTGMPIYQGFQGLWCYADREGRFEWRPRALQALILPYWSGAFTDLLDALELAGMVERYEVDGRSYGLVVNLGKHQAFNSREPASTLPAPPPRDPARARTCTPERNGKGMEGNGSGKGTTDPPAPMNDAGSEGTTLPAAFHTLDGWEPTEADIAHAEMAGLPKAAFLERIAGARLLPRIGGQYGTRDRGGWVRQQIPAWKRWREQDQAKASFVRAPVEPPKPKPPRVKGCPEWVRPEHETQAKALGLDVRAEAQRWAKERHIHPRNLKPGDAATAFTEHLQALGRKGAA